MLPCKVSCAGEMILPSLTISTCCVGRRGLLGVPIGTHVVVNYTKVVVILDGRTNEKVMSGHSYRYCPPSYFMYVASAP